SVFGLIMRIFKAATLLIIAPPVVAIMPLDGGKAYQQWRQSFIGVVLGAYGVVVAMNVFLLIMKVIEDAGITLFPDTGFYMFANAFVNLLLILVGVMMLNDISEFVADIIGKGDDVLSSASSVGQKIVGAGLTAA